MPKTQTKKTSDNTPIKSRPIKETRSKPNSLYNEEVRTKLFGENDAHTQHIEQELNVTCVKAGNKIGFKGSNAEMAQTVLNQMVYIIKKDNEDITPGRIDELIEAQRAAVANDDEASVCIKMPSKLIKPKSPLQKEFMLAMRGYDLTFGVGPAGSGKTYLAVAAAAEALNNREVSRLVITRPVVEAGEKLGFLPGSLEEKISPYLRPIYDALTEFYGPSRLQDMIDKNVIEISPLAYMRGRTFNDTFMILDEGQNTKIEQMKMFLTRIGEGSKAVVTGDITQNDLPSNIPSGLKDAWERLEGKQDVGGVKLTAQDVVRAPIVKTVVEAYEDNPDLPPAP